MFLLRLRVPLYALVALVAGCGVAFPSGGTFVEVVEGAPESDCQTGGVTLRVGDDRNSDGTLDDSEVRAVTVVCSGKKDRLPQVDLATFDADERCASGGVEVAIEADANGNGKLEDEELVTRVLCHGDGGLLPGDVIRTASFAVVDDAQVKQYLQGVRRFEGDLIVQVGAGAVTLPKLEQVTGALQVRAAPNGAGEPAGATLAFPKLMRVDGDLLLTTLQTLKTLSMPALEEVRGALTVTSVTYLEALELPALRRVTWQVRLASTGLVRASFAALESAGSLSVELNARLGTLEVPKLAETGALVVRGNPRLGDCAAHAIAGVLREAGLEGSVVVENNGGAGQCPNALADCVEAQVEETTVLYCRHPRAFADAEADCASLGGQLFEPRTEAQAVAFRAARPSGYPSESWIGLTDRAEEGSFAWQDGSILGEEDWSNWASGEPSNSGGVEDCVQLRSDGTWNDRNCADLLAVACLMSK